MSFFLRSHLVVATLAVVFSAPAMAQIPQTEHDALIAFFNSTGGANWTNHTGWNGAAGSECSWFGVACDDASSHVTGILLASNNLSGKLTSLDNWPDLQQLYVQDNQLTGPVPAIGGLTGLQEFYVNDNQLSGPVPSPAGLTNLTTFDVDTNLLTGTIPALTGLPNLFVFNVESNQLTGPIPSPSGLSTLAVFAVDDNQLTGAVPSLQGLSNLQGFSAGYNQLSGTLPSLAGLVSLTYFNVSSNQLTGAIPSLAGLTSLNGFDVSFNQLTGTIPELDSVPSLQQIYLDFNQLTGSVPALTRSVNLQDFVVDDNKLSGSIPSLSGLVNLQAFNVGGNQISGNIPSLSGLVNLQSFYADSDLLTGSIPDLTGLSNLENFSVPRNALTGPLPPSLSGLTKLQQLDASFNMLNGPIPALSGLGQLQNVYLGFNSLSGPIPAIAGLANLQQLVINDNQLSGSIPALVGLGNLQTFNAGNNQLSGSIPDLSGLGSVSYFSVTLNQLTGAIPRLTGLTSLGLFDASFNQLSGPIPSVSGLANLQYFYVGVNQLTGSIPPLTGSGNLLVYEVDDNQLSGPIPTITGLTSLQGFVAANNGLTGALPVLSGLGNLQYFEVGNNRLSGAIPNVPSPDNLDPGLSSLCPNALAVSDDAGWDAATGLVPWYSTCTSAASASVDPTNKDSTQIALSNNGSIKLFQSQETDLVAGNANSGGQDIYSLGANGQPALENIDSSGHQLIGTASQPAISPDGKVVAFLYTAATTNAKDLATGQMWAGSLGQPKHQVDLGMGNVPPNGSASGAPSLSSANGVNQLVFCSAASNLVPSDGNGGGDIFLVDPLNPAIATQRVSVDGTGKELPGDSCEPKLSGDGSTLVFSLSALSLYATTARQIVRKDLGGSAAKILLTGTILPITTSPTGQGAPFDSTEPTVNKDGSVIAFTSQADLDGLGVPLFHEEVFVSLPQSNSGRLIQRLHRDTIAVPAVGTMRPQISADGTTVVMETQTVGFSSAASAKDLAGAVPNQCGAVAITTNFFAVTPLGGTLCSTDGSTTNANPSISGDGITTGFDSNAMQGNGNTNQNTYTQGAGVNTDVTGNTVANLSGDFSGQWLDPSQSGQGLVIDVTNPFSDNSRLMVLTWFVFSNGQPTWVQGVGVPKAGAGSTANTVVVQMDGVGIFQGVSFPLGEAHATSRVWGSITLTFSDANTGVMNWASTYPGFNSGSMPIKHFLSVGLPESDAPGAQVKACFSGNWFNPAQTGHGFEFEVLPTTPALLAVDWFAFGPNGAPVWLQGVGPISGNGAQMQLALLNGAGAQFPPNFDSSAVAKNVWGTATFTFTDSSHATVAWNSTLPDYGSGSQPLAPLETGLLDRRACQ